MEKFLLSLMLVAAVGLLTTGCKKTVKSTPTTCEATAKTLGVKAGMVHMVSCPADCKTGSVWGTDVYTTDSRVCKAAVHAGTIKQSGGDVKVTISPGLKAYVGSEKNGVKTAKWGSYDMSFTTSQP